jgi:hypothetical protein
MIIYHMLRNRNEPKMVPIIEGNTMDKDLHTGTLRDQHYITVILRFALDAQGRLLDGELVDTRYSLPERFLGEAGMNEALSAWLGQQKEGKEVRASFDR